MAAHDADPAVRPLLAMLTRAEDGLERVLGERLEAWELAAAMPAGAEPWLAQTLTMWLVRVGDHAVEIQDRAWARLARKDVQTFRAARVDWAKRRGADLARGLTADTRQRIRAILAEAAERGANPQSIQRAIREIVPDLPGVSARSRAQRIARTELHDAAMHAQETEARGLAAQGARLVKVWTATMDARTRPAHARANGQVRRMDEDFDIGGARMSRPGDRKGGARNCVNCRCVCRYIPAAQVEDDRQRRARVMAPRFTARREGIAVLDAAAFEMDRRLAGEVVAEAVRSLRAGEAMAVPRLAGGASPGVLNGLTGVAMIRAPGAGGPAAFLARAGTEMIWETLAAAWARAMAESVG